MDNDRAKGIDPSDSQFYVCNESNDSDDEAEANHVLNELNDMILNLKKDEPSFENSSDIQNRSIGEEEEDYEQDLIMPRTESLMYEDGEDVHETSIPKPQVSEYNVLPKFDKGTEQADDEMGLRAKGKEMSEEVGLNQLMSPQ